MNKGNIVKNMGTHVILVTMSTLGGKKRVGGRRAK